MRIAVTGGAGFMGTRVVEALVDRGIEVIAIDAPEARHDRLVDGARYLWGDLRDPDLSIVACAGVDAVCHLASRTGSDVFDRVPAFVADNDVATAALLHSLHLQDFEGRLVLGSSADVYGEGTYECAEHGPVRPQRRRRADLERRRWDPACPSCGEPLAHRATTEAERTDPLTVFAREGFDRVFCSYTLSMIPPWQAVVEQAMRMLAPGGSLHIVDFGGGGHAGRSALRHHQGRLPHVCPRHCGGIPRPGYSLQRGVPGIHPHAAWPARA